MSTGNTSLCGKELVIGSYAPRFAISGGVIFANCRSVSCVCVDTETPITQSTNTRVVVLDQTTCNVFRVDGIMVSVGRYLGIKYWSNSSLPLGPQIFIGNLDINNQIADINKSIHDAEINLQESGKLLNKYITGLRSDAFLIVVVVALCFALLMSIVSLIVSCIGLKCSRRGNCRPCNDRQYETLDEVYYVPQDTGYRYKGRQ